MPIFSRLMFQAVRWAARESLPLTVQGAGLIDCHLYRQPGRLILHLVNLTSAGSWRSPVDELIPVGPVKVRVKLPQGRRGGARSTWCRPARRRSRCGKGGRNLR